MAQHTRRDIAQPCINHSGLETLFDGLQLSRICTYCAECLEKILHNVCATCGGGFAQRPIRPQSAHRDQPKLGLRNQPPAQFENIQSGRVIRLMH
ncbi:DUF1272 domain-containing protein [Roseovarius tolerans]|uniref:DUF1272 domain-containing protein n=1 Tax=Roseovarius tolerans TaxID=74031 RepID=UPI003B838C03